MTALFPARRSAQRFDALVEGARRDDVDRSTADLLELVGALREVPEASARPEFVSDLRERLMLAAADELVPVAPAQRDEVARLTIKRTHTRRERRIGIALGAAALIGATTSMAVASQSAIPGDALYPVKRGIENVQAGFSVGDDAKGRTMMGNASRRLDELDKLTQKKQPDAKLIKQTLDTFAQQFSDGSNSLINAYEQNGDPASIRQVHHNAELGIDQLSALNDAVPADAHQALVKAAGEVLAVDAQALSLCSDPACGGGVIDVPPQLLAGGAEGPGGLTGPDASGQLPGTGAPTSGSTQEHNGGQGAIGPSGLNPPATPIQIPTQTPDVNSDLGTVLGTNPSSDPSPTTSTGGNHHGGKGDKGDKGSGVDLTPVTTTVDQVVTGVVDGVSGLLSGLTGSSTTP